MVVLGGNGNDAVEDVAAEEWVGWPDLAVVENVVSGYGRRSGNEGELEVVVVVVVSVNVVVVCVWVVVVVVVVLWPGVEDVVVEVVVVVRV